MQEVETVAAGRGSHVVGDFEGRRKDRAGFVAVAVRNDLAACTRSAKSVGERVPGPLLGSLGALHFHRGRECALRLRPPSACERR